MPVATEHCLVNIPYEREAIDQNGQNYLDQYIIEVGITTLALCAKSYAISGDANIAIDCNAILLNDRVPISLLEPQWDAYLARIPVYYGIIRRYIWDTPSFFAVPDCLIFIIDDTNSYWMANGNDFRCGPQILRPPYHHYNFKMYKSTLQTIKERIVALGC